MGKVKVRKFKRSGIYAIINLITLERLIGNSKDIDKRWSVYRSGKMNYKLKAAVDKYGIENFEFVVIEYCKQSDLAKLEKKYINEYNTIENGYNIRQVKKTKKKIRRGKEAKNYSTKCSLQNSGDKNPHYNGLLKVPEDIQEIKVLLEYSNLKQKQIWELFKDKCKQPMISRIKTKNRYKNVIIDDLSENEINKILEKHGIAESSPFLMGEKI